MGSLNRTGLNKRKHVSKHRPKIGRKTCPDCGGRGRGEIRYGITLRCTRCGGSGRIW